VQRRIAQILSAYDELIENCEQRVFVLEQMASMLYREWFVLFRYPGREKVPLVDSPLGRVPRRWSLRKLGEVLELRYGKALKADARRGGEVPVFGSSGVVGQHDESLTTGPGIIVGRKGNVGSIFWSDTDFFVIDTAYFVSSRLPLRFLYFDLQRKNFINGDAAVPGLSRAQAYGLETLVPPDDLVQRFADLAEGFLRPSSMLRRQADILRRTRDLLLPRLLSGQLAVDELL
jgi:type I restriction enzyme S subunit